ncbi:hypothetical protein BDV95DRAFT_490743 [Massariosphaeria phaeospora]|uniref:Cell death in tomato 1 n=1 Tax=Massariosphaeria phaeospora TaxID=100035 RepID=A0A7C8I7Z5_9PLEO|nr:hypothetical protein BDV95DRAFT_490743 [Massariosphaeria phaeospora]
MHFTSAFAATLLALTSSAVVAATPLSTRKDAPALAPWQLTSLSFFSPSGRPGSYPWSTLTANITDPNVLTLGTNPDTNTPVTVPAGNTAANCQAKWFAYDTPFGRKWPCDASPSGYWYMEVVQTDQFSFSNYKVKFTRVAEVLVGGAAYRGVWEGQALFRVGTELSGTCGGSGVCSSGLKSELRPFAIKQKKKAE